MSDWNTLHFFNDEKFYSEIVPDLQGKGILLSKYLNSESGKYLLRHNIPERTSNMIAYCHQFDSDFKTHKTLREIESRVKSPIEEYQDFVTKRNQDQENFFNTYAQEIEDLNRILPLIIFSECAIYQPYFILGRRIFTGNIGSKTGSFAEACCHNIVHSKTGSSLNYFGSGLTNWLTKEEVNLLLLDKDNLYSRSAESEDYLPKFIAFLQSAYDNKYGFIAVTNINKSIISDINPKTV